MGSKFVEGRSVEFSKSYEESSPSTPIFFILSPGVDPLKDVEALGKCSRPGGPQSGAAPSAVTQECMATARRRCTPVRNHRNRPAWEGDVAVWRAGCVVLGRGHTRAPQAPATPRQVCTPRMKTGIEALAVGLFTPKGEKAGKSRHLSAAEWPIPAWQRHTVGQTRAVKLADAPWKHCAKRNPSRMPRPLLQASACQKHPETQSSGAAAGGGAESAGTCRRAAQHGKGIKCH